MEATTPRLGSFSVLRSSCFLNTSWPRRSSKIGLAPLAWIVSADSGFLEAAEKVRGGEKRYRKRNHQPHSEQRCAGKIERESHQHQAEHSPPIPFREPCRLAQRFDP